MTRPNVIVDYGYGGRGLRWHHRLHWFHGDVGDSASVVQDLPGVSAYGSGREIFKMFYTQPKQRCDQVPTQALSHLWRFGFPFPSVFLFPLSPSFLGKPLAKRTYAVSSVEDLRLNNLNEVTTDALPAGMFL